MHQLSHQTQDALKSLSQCAITCHSMALVHCLELGGEHARPQHLRLMLDCATVCAATAELVAHKSQFHTQICSLCVEICETCAGNCEKLGQMEDCVSACRNCATHCRELARSDHALDQGATHTPAE